MTPTKEQLEREGNAVVEYLKRYSLSKEDFAIIIFKRKEVSLDEAKKMIEKYLERYPAVAEYFKQENDKC